MCSGFWKIQSLQEGTLNDLLFNRGLSVTIFIDKGKCYWSSNQIFFFFFFFIEAVSSASPHVGNHISGLASTSKLR